MNLNIIMLYWLLTLVISIQCETQPFYNRMCILNNFLIPVRYYNATRSRSPPWMTHYYTLLERKLHQSYEQFVGSCVWVMCFIRTMHLCLCSNCKMDSPPKDAHHLQCNYERNPCHPPYCTLLLALNYSQ